MTKTRKKYKIEIEIEITNHENKLKDSRIHE